jgi:hypothetical protein
MKKFSIAIVILTASFIARAQDNKPAPGSFGVGYGVSFFPLSQDIRFTYMVDSHIEVGGAIGLGFSHSRSSTFDSTTVFTTGFTALAANEEHRTVTTSTSFAITPLVKYHFTTKNNLDIYTGADLPVGVSTGNKTVVSDIVTATDYNSTGTTTTKPAVTATVGAGILLGCQYFFYQNLALGAEANIGFTASIQNGNDVSTTSVNNSGSNNPAAGITIPGETTMQQIKNDDITLGMLHHFSLSLAWYFGTKSR